MRDVAPPPGHELHGQRSRKSVFRALGLGVVTGACDDDPVAIGTYASAGASFGASFLWTAPATFPMMYAVVYLSFKLGQVTGKGLFHVIKDHFSRWLLWPILVGVLIGNTIEAGADLGGMAAAINLFVPLPIPLLVVGIGSIILALQIFGSYELIRNVFRWFALALLAYVGSAILAKPDAMEMLSGTFIPRIQFTAEFLAILVAVMGTTLSAYPYTWQSNVEVEEEILKGRTRLEDKRRRIAKVQSGYCPGYAFSNVIMYSIILSTASTLHKSGQTNIETAAHAAEALRPLAGDAAGGPIRARCDRRRLSRRTDHDNRSGLRPLPGDGMEVEPARSA